MALILKAVLLLMVLAATQLTQAQDVGQHALDYTYAEGIWNQINQRDKK